VCLVGRCGYVSHLQNLVPGLGCLLGGLRKRQGQDAMYMLCMDLESGVRLFLSSFMLGSLNIAKLGISTSVSPLTLDTYSKSSRQDLS
jgi:hypothetical protein